MSMNRVSYIRGPARVVYNGHEYQTKGGIKIEHDLAIFKPESDLYGPLDGRLGDRVARISFTPIGIFDANAIADFWPLSGVSDFIGGSIFGAPSGTSWNDGIMAGRALKIFAKDTNTLEYVSAVSKMPDLILSATKTTIGMVTLTGLGVTGSSDWESDYVAATGTSTWVAPTGDVNPVTQSYSVAASGEGNLPSIIETTDGVTVSFNEATDSHMADSVGTVDLTWRSLEVVARFTPVNVTVAQMIAAAFTGRAQGTGAVRGASMVLANSAQLVIRGKGAATPYQLTVNRPYIDSMPFEYSPQAPRVGQFSLCSTKQVYNDWFFKLSTANF